VSNCGVENKHKLYIKFHYRLSFSLRPAKSRGAWVLGLNGVWAPLFGFILIGAENGVSINCKYASIHIYYYF